MWLIAAGFGGRVVHHPIRHIRSVMVGFVLLMSSMAALSAEPMSVAPPALASPDSIFPAPVGETEQARVASKPRASAMPAHAEVTTPFEPIVVPLPATPAVPAASASDRINVVVLGDSLGDGLWAGVYHVFMKDKQFNVIRKSRVATGLVRADYYDWEQAVREIVATTRVDVAVVVMGTNDRQVLVDGTARHVLFNDEWKRLYKQRVDDFTQVLTQAGARVYWLELPVMRSPRFENDMQQFNAIFSERAAANNIHFVPTRDLALGPDGGYTAYGADRFGKTKLLRAEDGIHFSLPGYELLGARVADVIRRDMNGQAPQLVHAKEPVATKQAESVAAAAGGVSPVAASGQQAPSYDVANIRPGRSDDWRWYGDIQ